MAFNRIKHALKSNRKIFNEICKVNDITLDYSLNKRAYTVFHEIFTDRIYANYFPFYERNIILDIGAHYGFFSLFAHVNSLPDSTIISVEPASDNFTILQKNLSSNNINTAQIVNKAMSHQLGNIKLFKSGPATNSLITTSREKSAEIVVGVRIIDVLNEFNLDEVDFMKMDCEGAEYDILFNTPDTIFDKIKTISLEFHDLKRKNFSGLDLLMYLKSKKYQIVKFRYSKTTKGLNYGHLIATRL